MGGLRIVLSAIGANQEEVEVGAREQTLATLHAPIRTFAMDRHALLYLRTVK